MYPEEVPEAFLLGEGGRILHFVVFVHSEEVEQIMKSNVNTCINTNSTAGIKALLLQI